MEDVGERFSTSPFPHDITLDEARASVKGMCEFGEKKQEGLIFFNYKYCNRSTFPDPSLAESPEEERLLRIRRECRGLVFDEESGLVVARRYHKFFNIGELEETQLEKIDFSSPHVVLTKYDGTLVTSLLVDGAVRFATKGGLTDVAKTLESRYVRGPEGKKYVDFCSRWSTDGFTPIFEYCTPRHRIVLRYESDLLVLTAIRHNRTGYYLPYKEMCSAAKEYGVHVTELWEGCTNTKDLESHVKGESGIEGFVIRFEHTGLMYKIKTEWYFARTRKSKQEFSFNSERNVWKMVLNQDVDDALARMQDAHLTNRVHEFQEQLWRAIEKVSADLMAFANVHLDPEAEPCSKKDFVRAVRSSELPPASHPILYKIFDSDMHVDVRDLVIASLTQMTNSSTALLMAKDLLGGLSFSE